MPVLWIILGVLAIAGAGKERPIEICSDEACWSKNRRAVTVVSGGFGA